MEEYFDDKAVIFLENEDFDAQGKFVHDLKNRPLVVMMGGTFCPHCRHAAPAFNDFAKQVRANKSCVPAVIQIPQQRQLAQRLGQMYPALGGGVPCYFMCGQNGRFARSHEGDRTKEALIEFAKSA